MSTKAQPPRRPLPPNQVERLADVDKAHVVMNVLMQLLRKQFSDYAAEDVTLGVAMTLAVWAKQCGAVEGSILSIVRKCLRGKLSAIPMGKGASA